MLEHDWDKRSVEFPLTQESVVFEVGGYIGRWAREIAERFDPELHVFEPQRWAYDQCRVALLPYPNATVYPYGLATERGVRPLGNFETDGCSLVNIPQDKPTGVGEFEEIRNFLDYRKIRKIDLMLMNIEGYEFELIPHMIETGIMKRIHFFMCQFHLHERNECEYYELRKQIAKGRHIRFDYGPVLTCWEKN